MFFFKLVDFVSLFCYFITNLVEELFFLNNFEVLKDILKAPLVSEQFLVTKDSFYLKWQLCIKGLRKMYFKKSRTNFKNFEEFLNIKLQPCF